MVCCCLCLGIVVVCCWLGGCLVCLIVLLMVLFFDFVLLIRIVCELTGLLCLLCASFGGDLIVFVSCVCGYCLIVLV